MRKLISAALLIFTVFVGHTQIIVGVPHCQDIAFHAEVDDYLEGSVPTMDVEALFNNYSDFQILDAREIEEFQISHLPGAIYVGYDKFSLENISSIDPSIPIVIYCSIGFRSEKIGEKLMSAGYGNIYNLYGSIFEWVNRGYPLDDQQGQRTTRLHTYNKSWSKWVSDHSIDKIW